MTEVYGFKHNEEELLKSTSGGAFIELCRQFDLLYEGEKRYYGVTYTDTLEVVHSYVRNCNGCHMFQGSKYVRSDCGIHTYASVEAHLNKNFGVLFSGTPCQIYGLKKYLKSKQTDADKLFLIDIICHGTPVKRVWDDYKSWLEKKYHSKLIQFAFRYKAEGWKAYPAYALFENKKELTNTADTSVFSNLQMKGYLTAKGCFQCQFSSQQRYGDITLGDFWGVETIAPEIPNKKGVSLILVHTKKGRELIESMQREKISGQCLMKIEDDRYLNYQHNLRKPTSMPETYASFWRDYEENEFEYILKKYANYGFGYKILHAMKKSVRKTPMIEWYRNLKEKIKK